jgi:hypothetical protein
MLDPTFRRGFAGDPAAAAKTINVTLTPEEIQSFKAHMVAFLTAATELEKGAANNPNALASGHVAAIFRQ